MVNGPAANSVVTALSFVGGAGIVVGYVLNPNKRIRQKMVLGLGVTDAIQAVDVLIGSAYNWAGHKMVTNSAGCELSGFLYQATAVAATGWTVAIALITYITLCHPVSRPASWIEHKWANTSIWVLISLMGLIPASAGTAIFRQQDVGGVCWYTPGSMQASLMIFIPRVIALVLVVVIYVRIWFFFAKRDLSLLTSGSAHSQTDDHGELSHAAESQLDWNRRLSSVGTKLADWGRRKSSGAGQKPDSGNSSPTGLSPIAPSEASHPGTPAFSSPTPHVALKMGGPPATFSIGLPGRASARQSQQISDNSEELEAEAEAEAAALNAINGPPAQLTGIISPTASLSGAPSAPTPARVAPQKRASFMVDPISSAHSFALETLPRRMTGLYSRSASKGPKPLSPRQLNRRLSVLMSLYPIAYLFLFSVSVARLIVELIHPGESVDPGLVVTSRLLVYGQGAVDGLIYAFTETMFRRWTKGRT